LLPFSGEIPANENRELSIIVQGILRGQREIYHRQ